MDRGEGRIDATRIETNLKRARELIDAQYDQPLDLDELARAANFSRFYFLRAFRRAYHATPHEYLTRKRIEHAKELLAHSNRTVTEICFDVGFTSLGSFSTLFHRIVGWSPSIYRARAWEMQRNPRKFIPACYIVRYGLEDQLPRPHENADDD
ncbi:MAG TPA: AraC family transcriptional regulator [Anaerolineae bacterium]|nr:AraC family transcriptional regulator [Anaerolineae bacterium]